MADEKYSLTLEEMEAIAESLGFKEAAPDHPIHSEGPTIAFIRREAMSKPAKSAAKDK